MGQPPECPGAGSRGQSRERHGILWATDSPAIYLVNFLILYMVNPREAANMPAFKAPIPKAVAICLEKIQTAARMLHSNTYLSRRAPAMEDSFLTSVFGQSNVS